MSDGITDMHREEERRAAEMVEKCCENCRHSPISPCEDCNDYSSFDARKYLIAAKVEELRNQRKSWESEGDESKKKSEREEMIEALMSAKTLFAFHPNITDQEAILMDKINTILKKAEGK